MTESPNGSLGAPATVFVSYSREDLKRARAIIDVLEQAGYSVWWDGLLAGGERYSRTTAAALNGARAVVVLWSRVSIDSHWVHDEAMAGRDRGCLVPLSIDGSEPPLGFRQYQVIDVTHAKFHAGAPEMQNLLRAVAALHDQPVQPQRPPAAAGAARISRRVWLGGGAAVALAGGGFWAWRRGWIRGARAPGTSVAVLPFANLSADPQQTYFAEGLAAEVRAELARNPLLQVVAQASSNKFRDRQDDAPAICAQLGVGSLLDGNVRRAGSTIRVAAELVNGSTGFSQWSRVFDGSIDDVFVMQSEIARAVADALSAAVASRPPPAGATPARVGETSSVAAYDAYLRGRDLYELGTSESTDREALAKFDAAIAADPGYGAAYAARSRSLAVLANLYAQGAERRALYDQAIAAANKAVAIAPQLADAHSALGFALFSGRVDVRAARPPYERSFELGAGDADVLGRYALFSARTGRLDAARTAIARAARLDPLNARVFRSSGAVEYAARRYRESIPLIERGLTLNPKMGDAWSAIGNCQLQLGLIDDARRSFAREPNSSFGITGLAIIEHRQGNKAAADAALARLIEKFGDNSWYLRAQIFTQWGDVPRALDALRQARASSDSGLIFVRNDPYLDPLRKQPEFSRMLAELGFEQGEQENA